MADPKPPPVNVPTPAPPPPPLNGAPLEDAPSPNLAMDPLTARLPVTAELSLSTPGYLSPYPDSTRALPPIPLTFLAPPPSSEERTLIRPRPKPMAIEALLPEVRIPPEPATLQDTGLDEPFLCDLVLKHVYFGGSLDGLEVATRIKLDFAIVNEILDILRKQEFCFAQGGSSAFGGVWTRWAVSNLGRHKVEEILARDNYRGPAPVPFEHYVDQLRHQSLRNYSISPALVERSFSRLVLDPSVVERIGPAINSGRSIFLYGPSGNGKTALAECITETIHGGVFVPHALLIDSEIVLVYDEVFHRPIENSDIKHDKRWVYSRRPVVVVGGELTLDMLDLAYSPPATFHKAPFQVKANSGVLFIDDFGRQRVDPEKLLNRWIVPLESQYDFLTFHSGQKAKVPFDSLVVFSTNLNPRDLVDEAFLRRIRYKILVGNPSEYNFKLIFQRMCDHVGLPWDPEMVEYLLARHYRPLGRELRACQPRDIIEQVIDIQKYTGTMPLLSEEIIDRVAELYFVEL